MSVDRRHARILAMQALCQWEVQLDESIQALDDFFASREAPAAAVHYARNLVQAFWARRKSIDERIGFTTANWELARIAPVERNAIRVAVVEMLSPDVPPRVALDEAIEIARAYGGEESPRFVNGVLDRILRSLQTAAGQGG